jgi:hypothetical protein
MSQKAWAARPWFWLIVGVPVVAFVVVVAVTQHTNVNSGATDTSSTTSSSSTGDLSWCYYFEKAGGQMQNIANGVNQQTATVSDEATYFGQLSGDLGNVENLASGGVASLAHNGSVAAAQTRVRLLGGEGLGAPAQRVLRVMNTLRPKCANWP